MLFVEVLGFGVLVIVSDFLVFYEIVLDFFMYFDLLDGFGWYVNIWVYMEYDSFECCYWI